MLSYDDDKCFFLLSLAATHAYTCWTSFASYSSFGWRTVNSFCLNVIVARAGALTPVRLFTKTCVGLQSFSPATGLRPPCVGTLGCTGPAKTCQIGCRREFDWLICIALLSCNGHKGFFGLLPLLIQMRVFADQCYDVRVLHPSSTAATFCLICSMGICQGMSWQHLHQP